MHRRTTARYRRSDIGKWIGRIVIVYVLLSVVGWLLVSTASSSMNWDCDGAITDHRSERITT